MDRSVVDRWGEAIAVAQRQHGPIAARQAVALGVPRTTFFEVTRRHRWGRPFPGVAVLPGVPLEHEVLARAAALAIGGVVAVSGESALSLHGIVDDPPPRPQLVVPNGRRTPRLTDVRVTRSRTLRDDDARSDGGVLVATPARAVLDGAARAGTARIRGWLIDGRQRRRLRVADVARRAARATSSPGRGRVLAACRDVDASGADSALVAEVERRLLAAGFELDVPPRSVPVHTGRTLHPDVTIRGVPVGIEVDGYGSHSERRSLDLDQRKHNAYALVGWLVMRLGWTRLTQDWPGFLAELRQAIDRAGAARHLAARR